MVTSMGLAILAKEKTFSSTVIDLKKKDTSQEVPAAAPAQKPDTDSHSSSDPATAH
jgi:preprotein translocase subunit SecG